MGFAATEQVIRERFADQWPTLQSGIAYTFDNAGDDASFPEKNEPFVRLTIQHGSAFQVEHGNCRRWRRPGVVMVQIFIPTGQGTGDASLFADSVRDIFEGRTINGVLFRATSAQRVGIDGPWLQWSANTPFQADELR